ncbi:ATP-grasp domain-containing protein [Haloarcula salinisoli]|uniref:ATP-grasp domain-containing protein n=1 Tax=Haloarcula salinisoli TaxID=2487746 RepID=A0A8J7YMT0_9EURY|nr:ATP-grasp domain-containing protein [Halomicroarcula salinisoli]MBX0286762.1 ATP-grasp domain-containing protein [Halomicroarcula salinisoli]MBX0304073.1 ATP-grasp domain-containing protein [Halomicroarcula salinisoli]
MSIVVIGRAGLGEIQLLEAALRDQGGDPIVVDISEWPGGAPIRLDPASDEFVTDAQFSLDDVGSVYAHAPSLFRPTDICFKKQFDDQNPYSALIQLKEYRSLFESLCRVFESNGVPVIPSESTHYLQERKPWQLRQFEQRDLPVPDTVFTNDPSVVREFCSAHERVLFKPVSRGAEPNVVTEADLDPEKLANLETAPVQFQAFVPGEDLRVYVLDGAVVGATRYESEAYSFKVADRRGEEVELVPATLSSEVRETALAAADATGLTFGAVDIRRRPDGGHALLEVNQTPAFAYADANSGQSVSDALAKYLTTTAHQP